MKRLIYPRRDVLHGSVAYGARLRQAREWRDITQSDLAKNIRVSQSLIAHIECSTKLASPEIVDKIATQTKNFQPVFFYREPSTEFRPDSVLFRAAAAPGRSGETKARRYAELVCEMAEVLLRGIKPLEFRLDRATDRSPSEAARRVRTALQLGPAEPISHMLHEIEKSGVLVLPLPVNLSKRDVFTLFCDRVHMHIMVLSDGHTGERIRQSSAHELGHIVLKHPKIFNSAQDQQAAEFAAEFLLPELAMRREMIAPITLSVLCSLKSKWRVSIQTLIQRGKDLGVIDESRARHLNSQLSVKGWREREPAEVPVERPRLLRQLAERSYGRNLRALADELGYQVEFVKEILMRYEGHHIGEPNATAVRRR